MKPSPSFATSIVGDPAYDVQLSRSAEADLERIYRHLAEKHSFDLAERWIERILEKIASLERFPDRGAVPQEIEALGVSRYRQLLVAPYRLFYRIVDDKVVITLIADGRRDLQPLLERRLLDG